MSVFPITFYIIFSVFPRLFYLFCPFFQVLLHTRGKLSDVYNVYKGLIALRKANPESFGANEAVNIDTAGYSKVVDVTSGTPTESATMPTTVPASGFVILKK